MQTDITSDHEFAILKTASRSTRVRRARAATSALFLVDGLTFGTWASLIPCFKEAFTLTSSQLGSVLFALVGGALISMPITGRLIARWGSNRIAGVAAVMFSVMLLALAWASSYAMLIGAAFLFGIWKGALDVSVNTQSIAVENAVGKPIISSFQGFWSLGGLTAACVLSLLLRGGFSYSILMMGMSALLLVVSLTTFGQLISDAKSAQRSTNSATAKRGSNAHLWLLSGLAFLALFNEGVIFDWSAVYAQSIGRMSVAMAPLGYAVFALCMALGRFLGDRVTAALGSLWTLRLSGIVTASGIGLAVLIHSPFAILLGFALVGFGVANMVPVIFGAAGRTGEHAGTSLATVSTVGYFGFLAGPPVIGFLAAHIGLPASISLVIASALIIAIGSASIVRKRAAETD